MTYVHFIIGGLMALSMLVLILSIPSIISIFRVGRKDYVRNIKIMYNLYKKLSTCYSITSPQTYNYVYPSGQNKTVTYDETHFYFPVFINDNHIFVISKKEKGVFWGITINDCVYDKDKKNIKGEMGVWGTEVFEIKTSVCIFTQILNDRFQKKLDKLMNASSDLDGLDDLNSFINGEIVSIRRESKLNQLNII